MQKLACRLCVYAHGFTMAEINSLMKTEEEFLEHVERVHHIVVKRKGETHNQARKRFLLAYPEVSQK